MTATTIVFDLGNVVLTNDHPFHSVEELDAFIKYFGVTLDNLELAFDIAFPSFKMGKITEDEFWELYLYTAKAKRMDISYAKKFFRKSQKENEHMLSLLKKLHKRYTLAALTTISKEWLDFKKEKYGLENIFKIIVSSGYTGLSKPDKKIYTLLLNKLQVDANEVLFIDDNELTLPPAQALGMQTILFRGQDGLEKQLETLGII